MWKLFFECRLKRKRYFLLRNEEDLDNDQQQTLEKIKETFDELGTAHAMKEKLRSVYRTAKTVDEARILLVDWTDAAKSSEIPELKTMSKTINAVELRNLALVEQDSNSEILIRFVRSDNDLACLSGK